LALQYERFFKQASFLSIQIFIYFIGQIQHRQFLDRFCEIHPYATALKNSDDTDTCSSLTGICVYTKLHQWSIKRKEFKTNKKKAFLRCVNLWCTSSPCERKEGSCMEGNHQSRMTRIISLWASKQTKKQP